MQKKYNYIYKTTNLINGKIYIGVHSTNNLEDGYIGCGIKSQACVKKFYKSNRKSPFHSAVRKYGYYSFSTQILWMFDTSKDAYEVEELLVDEDFIKLPNVYNAKTGGIGGRKLTKDLSDTQKRVIIYFRNGMSVRKLNIKYGLTKSRIAEMVKEVDKVKRGYIITKIRYCKQVYIIKEYLRKVKFHSNIEDLKKLTGLDNKVLKRLLLTCRTDLKPKKMKCFKTYLNDKYIGNFNKQELKAKFGLHGSGIDQVLKGRMSNYKSFKFFHIDSEVDLTKKSFKDKFKGVKFINPKGEVEKVEDTMSAFCKKRGLLPNAMAKVYKEDAYYKSHKGYTKYKEHE